jgi:Holliday junction resolvase
MTNKSAAKGTRFENSVIGILNKYTGLDFKRVPLSGSSHIKGDIFLVNKQNKYCIECKHYKDDHLTSKILTSKESQFEKWWKQAIDQASKSNQEPLLIFKFDRSKVFIATENKMKKSYNNLIVNLLNYSPIFIAKLEDWLTNEDIEWTL